MPRPDKGRTILSVRVDPLTRSALGDAPSAKARGILERWARRKSTLQTHRPATDGSAPVEEDSAAKLGPGRDAADSEVSPDDAPDVR